LKLLIDTNLLIYFFTTHARERLYSYFAVAEGVFVTQSCLFEFQKNIKQSVHTKASVKFSFEILDSGLFTVIPKTSIENSAILNLIDSNSMDRSEYSRGRRNRDLSFQDSEQILFAKKFGLGLATNDSYVISVATKIGVIASSPVKDLNMDLRRLAEVEPYVNNHLFFNSTLF
jgi:predicted nucleic acid-binding protein